MLDSVVLEVAIGLAYMYLLLSVVCMTLNEWVAGALALRAKTLEAGIRNLLDDPQGTGLASRLYGHPLLRGLAGSTGRLPSYIPSRTFAIALLDIVAPPGPAGEPQSVQQIRALVSQMPSGRLRDALIPLIDHAGNDLTQLRRYVETLFDDAMDRVSGWYKRRANVIIVSLALATSGLFNADTLAVANGLARNPALVASVTASAQNAMRQPLPSAEPNDIKSTLQALHLPLGWSLDRGDPRAIPGDVLGWIGKLLGLLFTGLAVSMGAPFWFQCLGKFVNLRSAGAPPQRPDQSP